MDIQFKSSEYAMRIVIFGSSSEITKCLVNIYKDHDLELVSRSHTIFQSRGQDIPRNLFLEKDIVIYLSSILYSKRIENQSDYEISNSSLVNAIIPIKLVKYLDSNLNKYTFCYLSSESALKGSYDDSYQLFKSGVDNFIREYALNSSSSRIFSIAPSTVLSGMTLRRKDTDRLKMYEQSHPKKRFLTPHELAVMIYRLCSDEFSYLSNTVIHINGGKFARNKYQ